MISNVLAVLLLLLPALAAGRAEPGESKNPFAACKGAECLEVWLLQNDVLLLMGRMLERIPAALAVSTPTEASWRKNLDASKPEKSGRARANAHRSLSSACSSAEGLVCVLL